jgi:hypothetical protein
MPGTVSSVGPVIDAIVAMVRALPAVAGSGNTPPVPVIDGPPGGANKPPQFVSIMGQGPVDTSTSRQTWASLGHFTRDETYNVNGTVFCYVGGDDDLGQAGPSDAQQAARDQASTLLQAVEAQLISDPDLSGQNGGNELVLWALVSGTRMTQTGPHDEEIDKGRWCQIDFTISVKNQLSTVS